MDRPKTANEIPATKADVAALMSLIAGLAKKLTGERPVIAHPDYPCPTPYMPKTDCVTWFSARE